MIKVDVCANGRRFEWRNGELFVVSTCDHKDTAWIDSGLMGEIRESCPPYITSENFPVFIVIRGDNGDRVMAVETPITFAGGDVLCFIKPIVSH